MNTPSEKLIPVELYDGPICGHRSEVRDQQEIFNSYLFELRFDGRLYRLAYKPAHRTTRSGKRWVLEFDCVVSSQRITGQ